MATTISNLRSAAVDGRLSNPIFRKAQLQKLHEKLSQNSAEIQTTIQRDTGHSKAEVVAEYWLAVKLVKDAYDGLNQDASLKDEYRIARSQNAANGREPVGIVVVEAARHAYLFCLLSALVPALAAGNCIVVKVSFSPRRTERGSGFGV
jgi:acyl-CoA reductase-like NAD-dependent aldehyde dehydrogenase